MLNKEKINLFSLMFLDQKLEFNYKKYNWKTEKNYFLIKNYILLFGCSLQIYFTNIISKFIDSNSFIHSLELSVLFLIILSSTFLIFTNDKIQFHYGSNLNILTGIFFFTMYNIKRIFFSDSIYYTLDGMTIFSLSVQYLSWVILIFSVVKANFKIMILLYLICACPWLYTFLVVSKISFMQLFLYHLMPTIFVILNHYQKELKNRQYFYSERLMSNSLKKIFW